MSAATSAALDYLAQRSRVRQTIAVYIGAGLRAQSFDDHGGTRSFCFENPNGRSCGGTMKGPGAVTPGPCQRPMRRSLTMRDSSPDAYGREFNVNGRRYRLVYLYGDKELSTDDDGTVMYRVELARVPITHSFERFLARIAPDQEKTHNGTQCMTWTAGTNAAGYGYLHVNGKQMPAHRFSHEVYKGPIPDGYHIDHLCRNPPCVNPDHLEAVTPKVNVLRGKAPSAISAARTHCIHGHEYNAENTIRTRHQRHCRACMKVSAAKQREKKLRLKAEQESR